MNNALIFGLYVAAVLGQFSDTRTTEVGLTIDGDVEKNRFGRFIINKLGISVVYALKCGVLPSAALLLNIYSEQASDITFGILAAVGFALGIRNYFKLSAAARKEVL